MLGYFGRSASSSSFSDNELAGWRVDRCELTVVDIAYCPLAVHHLLVLDPFWSGSKTCKAMTSVIGRIMESNKDMFAFHSSIKPQP